MVNDQPWVCCRAGFVFVCGKLSHSQCQVLVEPGNLTPDLCILDGTSLKSHSESGMESYTSIVLLRMFAALHPRSPADTQFRVERDTIYLSKCWSYKYDTRVHDRETFDTNMIIYV